MSLWVFEDRAGRYSARLRPAEREVLADVVGQVVELLGGDLDRGEDLRDEGPHESHRPEAPDEHPLDQLRLDAGPVPAPSDPALHRLLPDGSRGDTEVAAEFRRLTEDELRSTKVGALLRLRALLLGGPSDGVVVPPDEAAAVAAALTDVRLVVAERLGVHTEEDADDVYRLATDPGAHEDRHDLARQLLAIVSVMLGVLQDSLVELMLAAMPDSDEPDEDDRPDRHDEPDDDDAPPDPTRAPR